MTDEKLNAYELARVAEVQSPDSLESPGALFLLSVQDAVTEHLTYEQSIGHEYSTVVGGSMIADDCVTTLESHGTYGKWQAFVDLLAFQEDTSDLGAPEDMNQGADWALYMIAERLAVALLETADDES